MIKFTAFKRQVKKSLIIQPVVLSLLFLFLFEKRLSLLSILDYTLTTKS